jgi:twitching motility protein PilT
MAFSEKNLFSLVKVAIENGASDIHLRTDEPPCLRIRGEMIPVQTKSFLIDDLMDIARILISDPHIIESIDAIKEFDGGFEVPDLCRLRYNFYRFNMKVGIILRIVMNRVPSIKELGLNPIISKIALQHRGLILVTGATGSGKSTTLAAMINHINQNRAAHIVTIEDPIEYLHPQLKSRISQREVGTDTSDFTGALRSALRQDPDIILIGEMRDPETISIALKAAETGHLVLSTVHTTNALTTVGRIIAMFPKAEQEDVRKRLADNLYATISQRMLKSVNKGVVIAQEIMVTNPGIKECITGEEPTSRIPTIIAQGKNQEGVGSQTFDQHIMEIYQQGLISKETALSAVSSESDFLQNLIVG